MDIADIPDYVVKSAQVKGADDVICTATSGHRKQIRFANSEISIGKSWNSVSANIFMAKDRKVVYTSVNDFKTLDKTIDDMLSLANVMKESQNYHGIAEGQFSYSQHAPDSRIRNLEEELIDYVEQAVDAADEAGAGRVAGVLFTNHGTLYQATSGGASGSHTSADIEISLRAFATKEASGHSVQSVNNLDKFSPDKVGEDAGHIAKSGLNPVIGPEGKFDTLFTPLAFANLLERVASSASAGLVEAGMSFFQDKVGEEVGASNVTLADDGTNESMVKGAPFDNEGVPTRKNIIMENGVLKKYLHNTGTAKRFNETTTGNAGLVFPRAWNCTLGHGDASRDEIISEIKDGIYVTNVWYTRFQNYQTGDFSTIPRDAIFRIQNGEITGAIKDIRISENMLNVLSNIKMLANDARQIHWWEVTTPVKTPHVLVGDVNITKSTQ